MLYFASLYFFLIYICLWYLHGMTFEWGRDGCLRARGFKAEAVEMNDIAAMSVDWNRAFHVSGFCLSCGSKLGNSRHRLGQLRRFDLCVVRIYQNALIIHDYNRTLTYWSIMILLCISIIIWIYNILSSTFIIVIFLTTHIPHFIIHNHYIHLLSSLHNKTANIHASYNILPSFWADQ